MACRTAPTPMVTESPARQRERERIVQSIQAALDRGYSSEDLRLWLQGAIDMNERTNGGDA